MKLNVAPGEEKLTTREWGILYYVRKQKKTKDLIPYDSDK